MLSHTQNVEEINKGEMGYSKKTYWLLKRERMRKGLSWADDGNHYSALFQGHAAR